MSPDASFLDVVGRLQRGDAAAGAEVFHRFARRLIGLARGRLGGLAPKVDPEDVMQSVFKSFFRRQAEEPFDLAGWDGLWALLVVITVRKCGAQKRRFHAAARDVRRETAPADDAFGAAWEGVAREPTPEEAALLAETVEQLFRGLDAGDRSVLELGLQGYKAPEISAQVGRAERSVYRVLERARGRLERLAAEDEPGR